jgi:uncharacterized protein YkwD
VYTGIVSNIVLIAIIIAIVVIFWPKIVSLVQFASSSLSNTQPKYNFSFPNNISKNTTIQNVSFGPLINYTLILINKDRSSYGLNNVTLSDTLSGQQHADSMLEYNYFSHWDIYGMKPYMRYTLLGGSGAMEENIAYTKSGVKACIGSVCKSYGNINVTNSIESLEYSMMYNDSVCCNNGHRDNILNPYHNQVSLGIAYNSTNVYLVEDFVNNYIQWLNGTPSYSNGAAYLTGVLPSGYTLSSIQIDYDPPVQNMSQQQLNQTSDYSFGTTVAGVVPNSLTYYQNITTIVADGYYSSNNDFRVSFNMDKVIKQYGAGEYTLTTWVNDTSGNTFSASTYTIFVNQNGDEYTPSNV